MIYSALSSLSAAAASIETHGDFSATLYPNPQFLYWDSSCGLALLE